MKLRSFYSILTSVVVVLLLVAVGGFFWLFSQSPLNLLNTGEGATPMAAMFVPKQAPAMASLMVNPDQLEAFRLVVANPGDRRRVRAELNQIKQGLLATTGLSYEQDVKPWLGNEITLAVTTLDVDRDAANGRQPGYLLAIATKAPERSREFLQLFWQKRAIAGTDLVFEQYKGVKLIYGSGAEESTSQEPREGTGEQKGKGSQPTQNAKRKTTPLSSPLPAPASPVSASLASAAVGDRFILFASHPKVLRDAINNVQASDLSLTSASFYEQALDTLTQPRIGLAFINLPGLSAWLAEETTMSGKKTARAGAVPSESGPFDSGQSGSGKSGLPPAYQTMAIALELDRQGLLAETALSGNQKTQVSATLAQPVGALQYIPAGIRFSASGLNLDRLWSGLSADLKSYETVAQLVNQPLADLQQRWQIDLPKDVFSWVKGEYALGLIPDSHALPAVQAKTRDRTTPVPADDTWIFVAQRSDTGPAKQGIEHLDEIARKQGLSVGPLKLGEQTVYAWTRLTTGSAARDTSTLALQAEVRGVHGTVGNYEVFTNSIASMGQVLKAPEASLTRDARFQQAIAPLLQPNNGYLYIDWAASQPWLEERFPLLKLVELSAQPLFRHLESLTVSSYGSQSGVQRAGVFVKLAQ